ncbi:uncharacterized protein F4812DRAFT_127771 [Daldinia caldariorum]|uniref:uncharacterized protein n=1 Tax=Daldinia caldariorum TaxID=326644 RepID=UPI0020086132|nr:uncharacterized protein F4812DRAFT_127771 [Daldinia caldariorum]KAI1465533.1 hypothetical protein F4812DRAFT_127771 [Daldinia caldariorum]
MIKIPRLRRTAMRLISFAVSAALSHRCFDRLGFGTMYIYETRQVDAQMRSRNEFNRCDSRSYSGPPRPRTRRDSPRHAGEQGVELINFPSSSTVPSSRIPSEDNRALREPISYYEAGHGHLGMFDWFTNFISVFWFSIE